MVRFACFLWKQAFFLRQKAKKIKNYRFSDLKFNSKRFKHLVLDGKYGIIK